MNSSELNTGIIVQARTGSSRLPQKMILPFYKGRSILEIIIERFKKEIDINVPFIIATTTNSIDNQIQEICEKEDVPFYRGPENDVLLRFIQTSEKFDFDFVIRICADNPLLDISGTLDLLKVENLTNMDYIGYKMYNKLPSILSHLGFWGEVVAVNALKKAHKLTEELFFREHVTNYIYQNEDQFRIKLIDLPEKVGSRQDIRLTVDTLADFNMIGDIYSVLIDQNLMIDPFIVINFLDQNPIYLEMMKDQIEQNKK